MNQGALCSTFQEPGNIGVQNVVHLSAVDPDMERVQRIVLAAARAESIAEPEEFLLVDRIQQRSGGPLDNLVLKGGDCQLQVRRSDGQTKSSPDSTHAP